MSRVDRPRIVVTLSSPDRASTRSWPASRTSATWSRWPVPAASRSRRRTDRWRHADAALVHGRPAHQRRPGYRSRPLRRGGGECTDPDRARRAGRDGLRRRAGARVPVLGVCRGLQAINVFSGGSLQQHVPATRRAVPEPPSPSIRSLSSADAPGGHRRRAGGLVVNSYHHQAVTPDRLAPADRQCPRRPRQDVPGRGLEARTRIAG